LSPSSSQCPKSGEVQIWFAKLDVSPQLMREFESTMSQRECDRASRFVFERHKLRYIFAQGVLRDVLSRATGIPPADVAFSWNSFGKPMLATGSVPAALHFNLSHEEDLVAVGVTLQRAIGVDVEFIRPLQDLEGVARMNFTPGECASVFEPASEEARQRSFFRCWTRKESYIKAVGKGLSIPLNTFDTRFPPEKRGLSLPRTADAVEVESWWMEDLVAPAGFAGALTIEQGIDRIEYLEWRLR
jgi:4'-phosphopantetheinyl transferase